MLFDMPPTTYRVPDVGPTPTETTPVTANQGAWEQAVQWATSLPGWVWAALITATLVGTITCLPAARRRAHNAGAGLNDRRDNLLLAGALIPAFGFWIAVLIGSARGLIAFGRDNLRWTDGWEYLVPATLDGIAISFALLAFRAVRKERNPDRAVRVAWGSMIASAGINFSHEWGLAYGSALAGGYLALMSLLGMLIFDELLSQFEDGTGEIRRQNPKFGVRWFTWPTNTVCAWFAWRNYPPEKGTQATVLAAVRHLDEVRIRKAKERAEQVDAPPWWTPMVPWVRVAQLSGALAEQRSVVQVEQRSAAESEQVLRAECEGRINRLTAERDKVVADLTEQGRKGSEQVRAELTEQLRSARDEHAAEVGRLRAQLAERTTPKAGGAPAASRAKTTAPSAPGAPRLSDDEAVDLMLQAHPEPGYEWGSREVNRLTGAGFGRIPKLIAAVAERHAGTPGAGARSTDEDDKERAS